MADFLVTSLFAPTLPLVFDVMLQKRVPHHRVEVHPKALLLLTISTLSSQPGFWGPKMEGTKLEHLVFY